MRLLGEVSNTSAVTCVPIPIGLPFDAYRYACCCSRTAASNRYVEIFGNVAVFHALNILSGLFLLLFQVQLPHPVCRDGVITGSSCGIQE